MSEPENETLPPAPGSSALDQIETEAAAMSAGPAPEATPESEQPDKDPIPDSAFEATADMAISGIKEGLKYIDEGEAAAEIWDAPIFKQALLPVLKKYNISIMSLPPEITLIAVIVTLGIASGKKIHEARDAKKPKSQTQE